MEKKTTNRQPAETSQEIESNSTAITNQDNEDENSNSNENQAPQTAFQRIKTSKGKKKTKPAIPEMKDCKVVLVRLKPTKSSKKKPHDN